jgi:TIR domain
MADQAAGFLSYVQTDDEDDNGRISALADDLRAQYRMQTGEKFELFVDRESIQWGEAWEHRIENAIAGTTFFIPVITPSYFQSRACRKELLKFVREAE